MSQHSKQIGFSLGAIFVTALLVLLVYSQVSPLLNGAGEADMSPEAVQARIEPVGELNTGEPIVAQAEQPPAGGAEGQADAKRADTEQPEQSAEPEKKTETGGGRSGQEVYQASCFACHGTGASGAPKLGDAKAWEPRIDKGMEALMDSALNGVPGTAMTPKGTCNDCSEEELRKAVEYMVEQAT